MRKIPEIIQEIRVKKSLWNSRIKLLITYVLGIMFFTVSAYSQSPTVLTVGLGKMFPTITDAVASIAEPFTSDYKIQVDVPYDGYVENGLDIDVAALSMDGHTLEITGALSVENNVTYYLGDDLEYWVSGDDVTTFENVNAGGETARRVQGDSYDPDASYEYQIKNHLGSTMMTVNENGVLSGSIYDYFPYGKQELLVSFAGPQVTKTFTGKELDLYNGESVSGEDGEGRYYFGKRYYDADIAKWISTDPEEQFHDLYAYTGNSYNPIGGTDPDGGGYSDILKIAGRLPRNWKWAGKTHPSGVPFKITGCPDFSRWAIKSVKVAKLTGKYNVDEVLANAAAKLKATPEGYVWHHVEDGKTMQLIPKDIHAAAQHTGGAAVLKGVGNLLMVLAARLDPFYYLHRFGEMRQHGEIVNIDFSSGVEIWEFKDGAKVSADYMTGNKATSSEVY